MSLEQRITVFSAQDQFLFELAPSNVYKAVMVEEINGEHSLTIVTSSVLEKKHRLLTVDKTGKWREFVVTGCTQSRGGSEPFKQYRCVWSLQDDARLFGVDEYIDEEDNIVASSALATILSHTSRWDVGTVDVTTTAGADLIQTDGWTALSKLVENWGGEIDVTIDVTLDGKITRHVDLLQHVGTTTAKRRFDYTKDMTRISRKVDESNIGCRVRPYGKSESTIDGLKVKLTIEEVNDGKDYIQNDEVAQYMRFSDGQGGYEYPTVNIENSGIDDPELLMEWAESVLIDYTTPTITYEASVLQYEEAGASQLGVNCGDNVQCVDSEFFDGAPLRLESRVTRKETDLLDKRRTVIRIGNPKPSMTSSISGSVSRLKDTMAQLQSAYTTTAEYLNDILGNLNLEINATGGYVYLTDGHGLVAYDIAVDDPLVGYNSASDTWASKVVQIKGGSIRIADSKNPNFAGINDWQWRTVFVSGHIAADLVTAVSIDAGRIGSPNGGNYWNLDTGEIRIVPTALIGNNSETIQDLIDGVAHTITSVDVQYAQNQSNTTAPTYGWSTTAPTWQSGYYIWQRTATTDGNGTTYSQPTCISGREGKDGTSVSILGSYDTVAQLEAAHPTGSIGDGYIVAGDLYVWNGTAWENVGTIQGPSGTNGANGYVHVAWANSADGSVDFSTSVASGKSYMGTYTDNSATSSQTYSDYTWSLIRGDDGTGITSIVEQYYLSTSNTTQTGGSWSSTQPTWESGKYIWTRSEITWDTTPATVTYTTPILAQALTQANSTAKAASDTATGASNAVSNLSTQQAIFNLLTNNGAVQGIYMTNNQLYINASYIASGTINANLITSGKIQSANGKVYFDLTNNELACNKLVNTGSVTTVANVGSVTVSQGGNFTYTGFYAFGSGGEQYGIVLIPGASGTIPRITSPSGHLRIDARTQQGGGSRDRGYAGLMLTSSGYACLYGQNSITTESAASGSSTSYLGRVVCHPRYSGSGTTYSSDGKVEVIGPLEATYSTAKFASIQVSGSKNRVVDTDDYGKRLLYSYETPTPLFGDVGSGVIGEDGTCYVQIDDVFSETARTDMSYQVFLQACGRGELYVSEKSRGYFVVSGTANLKFDWEVKARQTNFEQMRLEDADLDEVMRDSTYNYINSSESFAHESLYEYMDGLERIQYEE